MVERGPEKAGVGGSIPSLGILLSFQPSPLVSTRTVPMRIGGIAHVMGAGHHG